MPAEDDNDPLIIGAGRVIDGVGSLARVLELEARAGEIGIEPLQLTIDPLEAGWESPVAPGHFRSGCAPIEALSAGAELIRSGERGVVVIVGEDLLRTRYAADKARRAALMAIYGPACSIPDAYTILARSFMRLHGMDEATFLRLADGLYRNYVRTASRLGRYDPPPAGRFEKLTPLFRAVDCANPNVDFSGRLLVASRRAADAMGVSENRRVRIAGIGLGQTSADGPAAADEIARYAHLRRACAAACEAAGIDFAKEFQQGAALLEAYTCYPPAPLGFLLASGIAGTIAQLDDTLRLREITVTGGMNIAKAPWNNPALNGLIAMYDALCEGPLRLGTVHGNGGLGYRQGVAILHHELPAPPG